MQKIKFLFIDIDEPKCGLPSDAVVKTMAQVFIAYDENEDGKIQTAEFEKILDKLERDLPDSSAPLPASLTLE